MGKFIKIVLALLFLAVTACTLRDPNNGVQETFYPSGVIKSQITLKNGLKDGVAKYFDNKGRLLSETEYLMDVKNGRLVNYNPETGKPVMEAFFIDDVQHGEVVQYYREGMLFRKSNYVNGRVDGTVTTFWPDGSVKATNNFKMGKPAIGLKEYNKSGQLVKQPRLLISKSLTQKNAINIKILGKYSSVEIYIDELEEGRYFNPKSKRLRFENGEALFDYTVFLYSQKNTKISVLAKVKTNYGNTLILKGAYKI